ncbi:MAG: hypothetical protein A2W19_10025 [Spirochaetes bacterium RBG_16_49_21]|nr:MAG: hypothetical protein A2W19_10025 [Spirochaetes bacterium RBG_16_49_21]
MHRPRPADHARIFIILLLLLIPGLSDSAPVKKSLYRPVILSDQNERYPLSRHLLILEDATGAMTIEEAASPDTDRRYARSTQHPPSYGFNDLSYWVKFRLVNKRMEAGTWFLELDYPHMDLMEVYLENAGGEFTKKTAGDIYPFNDREVRYRNLVFALLIPGGHEQTVYMHFSGKCSKQFPLTLWSEKGFIRKVDTDQYFLGVYYGIILVMMVYNLFLYFFIRDKSYLYYFVYIGSYGLVQMAYNGLAFQYLWPAYPQWHTISLPFLIGWAILWMAIFSQSFLHTREYTVTMHRLMRGLMGIGTATMIFSLAGNYLVAINAAMLLMVTASIIIMTAAFICMVRGYRPARFFLIAWLVFLCGLLLLSLNKLHILPVMFITEYANQIGSALEVTLLSVALADRINIMEQEKMEAQRSTIQAQEKYRSLVEGSRDIIFTLDEKWNFMTVNSAISTLLKISPESAISTNFLELIYEDPGAGSMGKKLIQAKLDEFLRTREPISFRAMFKSTITAEPKEMEVRLECINIEGMNEILGKAASLEEDVLMKCFLKEKQEYAIGNYLTTADDITQRITKNLSKFMEQKQITLIRIALREIIINAIEHGNLNISYSEKTGAIADDTYFDFIAERRKDPRYRGRRVCIEHLIDPARAVYKITDEGCGFEHKKVLMNDSRDANERLLGHGRGISLAKNIFDEVRYNEKGNVVLLVKKITA